MRRTGRSVSFSDLLRSFFDERAKIDTCHAPAIDTSETSVTRFGEVLDNNDPVRDTSRRAPDINEFQVLVGPL